MIGFSYYVGGIKKSMCRGEISYEKFVAMHQNPREKDRELLEKIALASKDGDSEMKAKLKQELLSFTPSISIRKGAKRRLTSIESSENWRPFMQLDFDKIPDKETALQLKEHLFENYPQILCSYISPSGLGVKCLMKIEIPQNLTHYKDMHKAIEKEMEQFGYFDLATKNAVLPLFLSIDENILARKFNDATIWTKVDLSCHPQSKFKRTPKRRNVINETAQRNRSLRILTDRISMIASNGHPQVIDAGLITGSRIAAGYVDESEARQMAEMLVKMNSYLSKGINGYITDVNWAITEGMKTPIYYD